MKALSKLFVIAGASVLMAGCADEPFKTQGQKYRDAFIEVYGEVSPEQEWNMASELTVTVDPVIAANQIQIYAQVGKKYYRVALYKDIDEITTIPFDAPRNTESLLVDIDGVQYLTTPGQTVVNTRVKAQRLSRAEHKVVKVVCNGTGQAWEPQFVIANYSKFPNGKNIELTCKVYAEADATIDVGYSIAGQDNAVNINQLKAKKDEWVDYSASFTAPNENCQAFVFAINGNSQANTYYFDDVKVRNTTDNSDITFEYGLWNGVGNGSMDTNFDFNSLGSGNGNDPGTGTGTGGGDVVPSGTAVMVENYAESNNDNEPQLQIWGDFGQGTNLVLEFNVYADKDWNLEAFLHDGEKGGTPGNYTQDFDKNISVKGGQWVHYTSNVVSPQEHTYSHIDINLNTLFGGKRIENTYYFANIKITNGSQELLVDPYSQVTINNMGMNHMYGTTANVPASSVGNPDADLSGNLRWLIVAEDLGAIGDVDFNDVVFCVEFLSTNARLKGNDWNVSENEYPVSRRDDGQLCLELSRAEGDDAASNEIIAIENGAIKLTALAAGGQLPVYLHYYSNDKQTDYLLTHKDASANATTHTDYHGEWHTWFHDDFTKCYDSENSCFTMINTYETKSPLKNSGVCRSGVIPTQVLGDNFKLSDFSQVFVSSDYTEATVASGFYITVSENFGDNRTQHTLNYDNSFYSVIGVTEKAKVPQMFMIPDVGYGDDADEGWAWPKERISITSVYPSFVNWYSPTNRNQNWFLDQPIGNRAGQTLRYVNRKAINQNR